MIKSCPESNLCKIWKADMSNQISFGRYQASPTGQILMNLAPKYVNKSFSFSESLKLWLCPENICYWIVNKDLHQDFRLRETISIQNYSLQQCLNCFLFLVVRKEVPTDGRTAETTSLFFTYYPVTWSILWW